MFSADTGTNIQRRFVIIGMGGSGKSEVCLKFAQLHLNRYVQCLVTGLKAKLVSQVLGNLLDRCKQ